MRRLPMGLETGSEPAAISLATRCSSAELSRALLPALYVGWQMPGDNIWRRLRQRNISFRCETPFDPF